MKTTDILEKLKKENIRVPEDWAVLQTPTGHFIKFITPSSETARKVTETAIEMRKVLEKELEKYMTEKQAVKESKLLKF